MQFSDTSTLQGILQDVYFLTKTNSTSYATNDVVRNVNRWVYRAVGWTLEANQDWEFDDRNLTTHPELTTTLVAGQKDYQTPSDMLKLQAAYVLNENGDYQKLRPISEMRQRADLDEVFPTDGLPGYYELKGGSIFLYPGPAAANVTLAAGLKLSVSREIDVFTNADTTQETWIPEPFARIASLGAAVDYLLVHGPMERAQTLRAEIEAIRQDLVRFYSTRNKETSTNLTLAHISNRNNTIV